MSNFFPENIISVNNSRINFIEVSSNNSKINFIEVSNILNIHIELLITIIEIKIKLNTEKHN